MFAVPRQARHCRVERGGTVLLENRCWRMIDEGPGGGSDINTHCTHHGHSLGLPVHGNFQRNVGPRLLGVSPCTLYFLASLPLFRPLLSSACSRPPHCQRPEQVPYGLFHEVPLTRLSSHFSSLHSSLCISAFHDTMG